MKIKNFFLFSSILVRLFSVLVIYFITSANSLYAQPPLEEAFFKNLTIEDNLPSSKIFDIAQDSSGFYWIATLEGLVKYDGHKVYSIADYNLNNYNILRQYITSLFVDDFEQLWIGTFSNGLWVLNLTNGSLTKTEQVKVNNMEVNQSRVLKILPFAKNELLISTNEGYPFLIDIHTKKTTNFSFIPAKDNHYQNINLWHINDCLPHKSLPNNYWITTDKGLTLYDNTNKTYQIFPYNKQNTPNQKTLQQQTKEMYYANENELWISSWGAGILHFSVNTNEWKEYLFNDLQPRDGAKNIIQYLLPKSDTELWIATNDYGPGIFNLHTKKFSFYSSNGLQEGSCLKGFATKIFKDKFKNIWFVIENQGLSIMNFNQQFFKKVFLPKTSIPENYNTVYSVLAVKEIDTHSLLIGCRESAVMYLYFPITNKWQSITFPKPYSNTKVAVTNIFYWQPNQFVVSTFDHGIFIYNALTRQLKPVAISGLSNIGLYRGSLMNDKIYVGTKQLGVIEIDVKENKFKKILSQHATIINNRPLFTYVDSKKRLFIGSAIGFTVKETNGTSFAINGLEKKHELFKQIESFAEDNEGNIWMASSISGIIKTNIVNGEVKALKQFHKNGGYKISEPYNIHFEAPNTIWSISESGIIKINTQTNSVTYIDKHNGLAVDAIYQRLFPVSDKKLYVASGRHLFSVNTDILVQNDNAKLVISNLRINQKPVWYASNTVLELEPSKKFISIFVSSINQNNSKYFYRVNSNSQWIEARDNEIILNNLPHGNYNVEIGFSINQLLPESASITVPIKIKPIIFETLLFKIAILLVIILVIYWFYKLKVQSIKKQEQLKSSYSNQIVQLEANLLRSQMNPHFLFNSINSIKLLLHKQESKIAIIYLNKFSKLVRSILNYSREEIISLNDELNTLENYINLEQLRMNNSFKYSIQVDEAISVNEIMIPPLLLQPFVENAIWHGLKNSQQGTLNISVNKHSNNEIKIIIEDNGVGRSKDINLDKKSFGTSITQERVDLFNKNNSSKIEISYIDKLNQNNSPSGTIVVLVFKNIEA